MKKILALMIISIIAALAGLLGAPDVYADRSATGEAECSDVGGYWQRSDEGASKCVFREYDTEKKCEEAKGSWISIGVSSGGYEKYCEVKLSDSGNLVTVKPRVSTDETSADCAVLPDFICGAQDETEIGDTAIWQIILFTIGILTALIGVTALAGIVYGSVLYSSAGGNPEQVKKARTIIVNVVIGIVAYALMYALLQWIVPGGAFN